MAAPWPPSRRVAACLVAAALASGWSPLAHALEQEESARGEGDGTRETAVARVTLQGITEPQPKPKAARVVIGPLLAAVWRPSQSAAVSYGPGVAFGAFTMIPLTSWLLTRVSFRQEFLSVNAPFGSIGIEGSPRPLDLTQPGLSALAFSAEVEGAYRPIQRIALRGGFGIAWARMVAPPPQAENFYVDTERALAVSTVSLSLGAAYSLVPEWLELGFRVSGGLPFAQNGTFLLPLQVVVDGQIAHIDPLPATAALLDATLELGLVF